MTVTRGTDILGVALEVETAFLRMRPAPRIERGSDGPAWEAEEELRVGVNCDKGIRGCVSRDVLHKGQQTAKRLSSGAVANKCSAPSLSKE